MRYLCAILCFATSVGLAAPERLPDLVFRDLADVPCHPLEPAEKDASVLVFFWQDCPVSNGYAPELNRIAASHTNCAFYIVQVDPELHIQPFFHPRQLELQLIQPVLDPTQHLLQHLLFLHLMPQIGLPLAKGITKVIISLVGFIQFFLFF